MIFVAKLPLMLNKTSVYAVFRLFEVGSSPTTGTNKENPVTIEVAGFFLIYQGFAGFYPRKF